MSVVSGDIQAGLAPPTCEESSAIQQLTLASTPLPIHLCPHEPVEQTQSVSCLRPVQSGVRLAYHSQHDRSMLFFICNQTRTR